jgi:hypothetical protein
MRNHIQMEEANSLQHRPSLYYMDNQGPSKWNHSPGRNERSMKNPKGLTHSHLVYLKVHSFEVIRVVKANILAPHPRHVTLKNLSWTYYSDHLRMHNSQ